MTWNISEFYQLAQHQLLPNEKSFLLLSLVSIQWKFKMCCYHIEEANRILSETFTWPEERQLAEAVGKVLMWSADTDKGRKFAEASFYSIAHVIAFAQSLHSTADILAQVLYFSLDLNRFFTENQKKPKLYLNTVVARMKKHRVAPKVVTAANCFLKSNEFHYLSAYVNTTKHKSLVDSPYVIGLVPGQEKHGLEITSFEYKLKIYPQKWVTDFIGADFKRLSSMFDATGIELTDFKRSQQPPTTSA